MWDDVQLHVHGDVRIDRIVPAVDTENKTLELGVFVDDVRRGNKEKKGQSLISIADCRGKVLYSQEGIWTVGRNTMSLNYDGLLEEWTPEAPNLYTMTVILKQGKNVIERVERRLGVKQFEMRGKQFYLNGKPYKLRGGSFTWHRWMRSPEGVQLGHNSRWFKEQLACRMKSYGANEINFHLGLAPTCYLDVCDSLGLLVRYEWSFFHGVPAIEESCR